MFSFTASPLFFFSPFSLFFTVTAGLGYCLLFCLVFHRLFYLWWLLSLYFLLFTIFFVLLILFLCNFGFVKDGVLHASPVDFYRFKPAINYNTLTLEEAESEVCLIYVTTLPVSAVSQHFLTFIFISHVVFTQNYAVSLLSRPLPLVCFFLFAGVHSVGCRWNAKSETSG